MHTKITLCLIISFFSSSISTAQERDWVTDSLSFYEDLVENAILENDFKTATELNKIIYSQGAKNLNAKVYDYFYQQSILKAYEEQHEVLANIFKHIGNLEFYRSNLSAAKKAFIKALALYQQSQNQKSSAGMAMNLAVLMERDGQYDSAISSYNKAMLMFEDLKDTSSISITLENIALAHKLKGNYDTALQIMNKVESILASSTPSTSERWISFHFNKGQIHLTTDNYSEAINSALKSLRLSEQLENTRSINRGYAILNEIYIEMKDTTNLKKYIMLGRNFAQMVEDKSTLATLDIQLSNLFINQGNYDSAQYYAKKGLEFAEEVNSKSILRIAYIALGNIAYLQKQFSKMIPILEKVISDFPSSEGKVMSGVYHNLGAAYMGLGNLNKADEYLKQSLALAIEINGWDRLKETYETLSINSQKQGDYKNAFDYFKLYKQYEDSIFTETKTKQIAEIETQYETEKKDQSIAALEQEKEIQILQASRQQSQIYISLVGLGFVLIVAFVFYYQSRIKQKANKALALKNVEIEEQNKEKEMLLKEIHHRVKNNLQIISSLLSMQTRTLSDSKTIDAMKESQSRVKTMALIHEKLYQYDNLARINMSEYMRQLSDFLSQTYRSEKSIKVIIESEGINLDIDTAVPLGLITNELLSNALKYAFEDMEQGEITIKLLKNTEGHYVLTISDTGKGLATDMDIENSKSLGLKLVRTLTRQINGNLSISSSPGATFCIAFSENPLAA